MQNELQLLGKSEEIITQKQAAYKLARQNWHNIVAKLTASRQAAARALDRDIAIELPPLKLEKARFTTKIEPLPESDWGEKWRRENHLRGGDQSWLVPWAIKSHCVGRGIIALYAGFGIGADAHTLGTKAWSLTKLIAEWAAQRRPRLASG